MTDQTNQTLPPAPAAGTSRSAASRRLKIALVASVALNLAVAGLVLGAWLGNGPHMGMPRDMSFGPFSNALNEADRRALRSELIGRAGEFRASREATRAEFAALLAALRTEPFDLAAMKAALAAIETRNAERLKLGRSMIETRLIEMSPAERLAFAERLERGLRREGKD
ncbi:periplasmic heavy metal sensor [Tabrizicola sp.]|jgi:uncharacterized membrane protein|uniref:periplasmic heavy metal sensor n=1 Tax=Tabrizicola sp. TaxID=2005166 RepID=UPI0025CF027B|nr:periplasmic heavy metal sensor [Tabrizicola sp.]MBY0351401.1 periplasmic heavy metal sensor [Tabrizicola sp.]